MRFVSSVILFIHILNYADCEEIFRSPTLFGPPTFNPVEHLVLKLIKQPIDHFDKNENRTFHFWYYGKHINQYSQPNAPIYIWITGSADGGVVYFDNNTSLVDQLVKKTNGSVFIMSQRYSSFANVDNILPHDKDYFKFLTTEQVLADYANLIKKLKSRPGFKSSKVVLVGTFEGGQQATWMRMKYPELVDAVVASNAALLAKKDFGEFFNVVHDTYKKYGTPDCLDKRTKHFQSIEEMFKSKDGIKKLKYEYGVCDDTNFTLDIDKQYFWFHGAYYEDRSITYKTSSDVKTACEKMPAVVSDYLWCFDSHVERWRNSFYHFYYLYQPCSEFGQFYTTSFNKQPFLHSPLEFHLQICKLFFGFDEKRIDEGIAKTNEKFGGVTPNITNVVFTYGELDARRLLGVTKNLSDTVVSYVIEGVGSINVACVSDTDSKELVEARNAVISLIIKWISN